MNRKNKKPESKKKFIFFLIVILISLIFQSSDLELYTYYLECANLNSESPLTMLGSNMSDIDRCKEGYMNDTDNEKKGLLLSIRGNRITIDNDKRKNKSRTWLIKDMLMRFPKNKWILYLSMVRYDLDIIPTEIPDVFLFAGEFGDSTNNTRRYSAWVWKFDHNNPDSPPKELKFINLYAGDHADRLLVNYLKRHLKKTGIFQLIQKWASSNQDFEIKAVLTNNCLYGNTQSGMPNCDKNYNEIMTDLGKMNPQTKLPYCLHDKLQSSSFENLHLLVKNRNNFVVQDEKSEFVVGFNEDGNKDEELKDIALVTIYCHADCNQRLEKDQHDGASFIVLGCYDRIIGIKTKPNAEPEIASFIKLVDTLNQNKMVSKFNTPSTYQNSIVQELVRIWKSTGKVYSIKAFAKIDAFNYEGEFDGIFSFLQQSKQAAINEGFHKASNINYLAQDQKSKKYYQLVSENTGNPKEVKYQEVENLKNEYLAILTALDKDIKFIQHDSRVSFVFEFREKFQLWTAPSKFTNVSDCYAPLKYLYGNKEFLSNKYANAIRKHSQLFDNNLKSIIEKKLKIRQIYPHRVEFATTSYSPIKILGTPDSTQLFPQSLENALGRGLSIQFLVQRNDNSFQILPNSSSIVPWIGEINHFEDPWLAWLCLADPFIKVVAHNENRPLRLCMVSGNDTDHNLWSWVARSNPNHIHKEYLLVNGQEKFFLTNTPFADYIGALSESISRGERDFFLQKADQPQSFTLMDFFADGFGGPGRVLLWRDYHTSQNYLSKVGDVANPAMPIYCFLPESAFQWDKLAQRYNKEWVRMRFTSDVAKRDNNAQEVWFGERRIGIMRDNQVGIFLPPGQGFRNFGYANYLLIKNLEYQEKLVYKPRETNGIDAPPKEDFFRSWVNEKWDREIWRANPLGFFDRVSNSTSTN